MKPKSISRFSFTPATISLAGDSPVPMAAGGRNERKGRGGVSVPPTISALIVNAGSKKGAGHYTTETRPVPAPVHHRHVVATSTRRGGIKSPSSSQHHLTSNILSNSRTGNSTEGLRRGRGRSTYNQCVTDRREKLTSLYLIEQRVWREEKAHYC